jgi:hypothetical protein
MHLALPSSMDLLWSRLGNVLRSLIYHRTKIVRNCFKSLYSWVAPPPLHAQALARGPLAAVRLHRTVGSGTARAAVRRRRRRCCQRGRTPAASRRLPGQRQRQAPSTATRPPSFGIHAESGVPLVVFHLSGPAVPASPEVRHPYPAPCHGAAHQELGALQGLASALRRHALLGTAPASPPSEAQSHSRGLHPARGDERVRGASRQGQGPRALLEAPLMA